MTNGTIPPSNVGRPAVIQPTGNEQAAKIIRLPDALQDVARARRIEGEVIKQNPDGSVRVRTPEGDVDLSVRGRQPQPGQQIEVDIPAGRPPRQVLIRPATPISSPPPVTIPSVPSAQVPIQTPVTRPANNPVPIQNTPAPNVQPPPLPNASAPSTVNVTNAPARPASPTLAPSYAPPTPSLTASGQQAPLAPQTPVRLIPATPAQIQQILAGYAAPLSGAASTITRAQLSAFITVQNTQSAMANQLVSIPAPMSASSVPLTTSWPQNISQPNAGLQTSLQTNTLLTPGLSQNLAPILEKPGSLLFTPAISASLSSSVRSGGMDVRIAHIIPTPVSLLMPDGTRPLSVPVLSSPISSNLAPAQSGTISAQVVAMTPQQLPVMALTGMALNGMTPSMPQYFVMQFSAPSLQVGTQLLMTPLTPGHAGAPAPLPSTLPALVNTLSWPVMDDLIQTLAQISPASANTLLRAIPSPGNPAQMGPALMLFMAAVRAGDFSGWLSDKKIDALTRAGKSNLVTQLTQDGSALSRASTESISGDWRGMMIPIHWQGEVHKTMLYTHQDNQHTSDQTEDGGHTRFIFDLSLSHMGNIQIDGLVRGERFDMIVRSEHPFSVVMQSAMRSAYALALEDTSLHGDITFQGDPRSWVHVIKRTENIGVDI